MQNGNGRDAARYLGLATTRSILGHYSGVAASQETLSRALEALMQAVPQR